MNHHYYISYKLDTELVHKMKVYASNAGVAFAACLKQHPSARLIKAEVWGTRLYGGYTKYEPPPVQRNPKPEPRPARALKVDESGCEFPFYEEAKSTRPRGWPVS